MNRAVWLSTGLLAAFAVIVGLRWGYTVATLSETEVINRYAQDYVTRSGSPAALTDCHAVPGTSPGIWIVVSCAPGTASTRLEYHVNRLGGLEHSGMNPGLSGLEGT